MKKIKAAILSAGLMLFISVLLLAILSFIFAKTSSLPKASLTLFAGKRNSLWNLKRAVVCSLRGASLILGISE